MGNCQRCDIGLGSNYPHWARYCRTCEKIENQQEEIQRLEAEKRKLAANQAPSGGEYPHGELSMEYHRAAFQLEEVEAERDALRAELAAARAAIEDHKSGSAQLAKWLEESRVEAMDAKRQAASDRARVRMMRVDLKQVLEGHRKHDITGLFLAIEEFIQKVVELDR